MSCAEVLRALDRYGLLLLQDKKLPSVVGTFTGEALSTSWWSHSRAQEIFRCLEQIEDEALATRLIGGKVTYVHKRLWPAIASVGASNERWQTDRLPADARRLLRAAGKGTTAGKGAAVRELQQRLLVVAEEVHTDAGRHELRLETWQSWSARTGVRPRQSPERARAELEAATQALGARLSLLPWAS